jgi:hypothetical protein
MPNSRTESRLSASLRTRAGIVRTLAEQFHTLEDPQGEEATDLAKRILLNAKDLADQYGVEVDDGEA